MPDKDKAVQQGTVNVIGHLEMPRETGHGFTDSQSEFRISTGRSNPREDPVLSAYNASTRFTWHYTRPLSLALI